MLTQLKDRVLAGYLPIKEDTKILLDADLEDLCRSADEIRQYFCNTSTDLCCIINGKSGVCSENCKFCAQSIHHASDCDIYDLVDSKMILEDAIMREREGIQRYSIVTSGRYLHKNDLQRLIGIYAELKQRTSLSLCASLGLLQEEDFQQLKEAGLTRYHNNLETSRNFFPMVCKTHTYDEKIQTIQAAQRAGLEVCSGGIMGMGETWEDRIELALELRKLHIMSIPINFLNPIKGTPLQDQQQLSEEEIIRIIAVFRFLHPKAFIRLAGGRGIMPTKGRFLLESGANAMISGDMLTTAGICTASDLQMLKELGRTVNKL